MKFKRTSNRINALAHDRKIQVLSLAVLLLLVIGVALVAGAIWGLSAGTGGGLTALVLGTIVRGVLRRKG